MSKYLIAVVLFAATVAAVAVGYTRGEKIRTVGIFTGTSLTLKTKAGTPAAAVQNLFDHVKRRQFEAAYQLVHNRQDIDAGQFARELAGAGGSLRTYSALQDFQVEQLYRDGDRAKVRANLQWATAVGAFYEPRDLNVVQSKDGWKVEWPREKQPSVPPQVIPITYPRWDVVQSGARGVNVNEKLPNPKVRVLSQSLVQNADSILIIGELMNEDDVPAFVSVNADLVGSSGDVLAHESSFDQVVHTLLPGQKTPFRIDFPGMSRDKVANVKLNVSSVLVSASDPLIAVQRPRLEQAEAGRKVLRGELISKSGTTINIPQVLAALYDDAGTVIWVEKTYLDRALEPQAPLTFAMKLPVEISAQAKDFDVAVNTYRLSQ